MTDLQKLAIHRIRDLIETIDLQMTAYALHRELTPEAATQRDRESSAKWSVSNTAQREAFALANALLDEE